MGKPIDANGTQAASAWSQIDWRKVEKAVLRLQHRIFMAKVKGDVKGMESLQRLLAPFWAAKLLAIRKVGQENSGRKTPGIDGVVSISDAHRERLPKDGLHCGCVFSKAYRCAITGFTLEDTSEIVLHHLAVRQGGGPVWSNLCFVPWWAQAQLGARYRGDQMLASLKDVPFGGI
jgi:reverse transcriptase-like protein